MRIRPIFTVTAAASVALFCLTTACSGEKSAAPAATTSSAAPATPATPPPSADQAKELVASSPEFGDYQFTFAAWSLPVKKSAMNEPTLANAKELAKAGWIRFSGDDVQLAKGEGDKRFLVRPNGFIDIVPLGKKELVSVESVTPSTDGNVDVALTWKWIPNEVGASFKTGFVHDRFTADQKAVATLQPKEGGGWEVLRIR